MSTESGGSENALCLTLDELTLVQRLYLAFGQERFTPRGYYLQIRGGQARYTSEQDVVEIYQAIAAHGRVLRPSPGVRGDDGWCLSPEALEALPMQDRLEQKSHQPA